MTYQPATCRRQCKTYPDCICAAHEAMREMTETVQRLVERIKGLDARMRCLEADGNGDRG
jgi:hypothetical protein